MKIELENAVVYQGSNLDMLPTLPDNSVDSIVTDPPYELGFMGKSWDNSGIAYSVELWTECMRVLKPGGHLLAFGGSRTWHRLAVAIEDAGFEMRDSIAWLYGSGFPKSMDISKQIDKQAGAERQVIGSKIASPKGISGAENRSDTAAGAYGGEAKEIDITAPATDEAKQWQGWGTALKPAFEPVVVARKPLEEKTVAANVLKYGTGGLNIDASRIGSNDGVPVFDKKGEKSVSAYGDGLNGGARTGEISHAGRWPANVILGHTPDCHPTCQTITSKTGAGKRTATFGTQETQSGGDGSGAWSGYKYQTEVYACVDGCPVKLLDEQSGISKPKPEKVGIKGGNGNWGEGGVFNNQTLGRWPEDLGGGASRFFYVAKASKKDRNEGLDELPVASSAELVDRQEGSAGMNLPRAGAGRTSGSANIHPTVKPTSLMEYLIKLVTPPNGTVLDPFTGSGSTGKAALLNGFKFIGIELTEEYLPIIEGRLKWASEQASKKEEEKNEVLF